VLAIFLVSQPFDSSISNWSLPNIPSKQVVADRIVIFETGPEPEFRSATNTMVVTTTNS
jgi:hypothetical protein